MIVRAGAAAPAGTPGLPPTETCLAFASRCLTPMDSFAYNLTLVDWAIFYVFWLIAALRTKRNARREDFAGAMSYRLLAIVAFALLVRSSRFGPPLATLVIPRGESVAALAIASSVCGLLICLWARVTLGTNWSSIVVVKRDHELIQAGPYRFVRHPIYTGMTLLFLANVLLSGRVGAVVGLACLVVSFYLKLLREEKMMTAQFPDQYPDYCRRVKRLIPFVH